MTYRLMYLGAVMCALICVAIVYEITTTGNTSDEWIVWVCVIIGFCLFGFGFVYEGRVKGKAEEEIALMEQPNKKP